MTQARVPVAFAALLAVSAACWIAVVRGESMMLDRAGAFLVAWVVSMAAMMLPSTLPVVRAFVALPGRPRSATVFVAAYLAVWAFLGVVALVLGRALPGWDKLAGFGLVLAGVYQLTPLKTVCLAQCRAPLGFLLRRADSALAAGLEYGAWCGGCCAGLMVALFAVGMSSIAWMAAVAGVIFLERAVRGGAALAIVAGLAMVVAGTALLA